MVHPSSRETFIFENRLWYIGNKIFFTDKDSYDTIDVLNPEFDFPSESAQVYDWTDPIIDESGRIVAFYGTRKLFIILNEKRGLLVFYNPKNRSKFGGIVRDMSASTVGPKVHKICRAQFKNFCITPMRNILLKNPRNKHHRLVMRKGYSWNNESHPAIVVDFIHHPVPNFNLNDNLSQFSKLVNTINSELQFRTIHARHKYEFVNEVGGNGTSLYLDLKSLYGESFCKSNPLFCPHEYEKITETISQEEGRAGNLLYCSHRKRWIKVDFGR